VNTLQIEWTAEQVCGECGEGVFYRLGAGARAICNNCGHEHPMSILNLDERERFEWIKGTLHVVSYM
jgi:hypothetical protein